MSVTMTMSMSFLSPPSTRLPTILSPRSPNFTRRRHLPVGPSRPLFAKASAENGSGLGGSAATLAAEEGETAPRPAPVGDEGSASANGSAAPEVAVEFRDPKWVRGTWDLNQFRKNGDTDWDAVIDAEARRRKWLEDNPESSSNDDPVVFDTSIIPWWVWMKRFHLPEAELLNGRAAMVGFFMAYLVDSLTGLGLVDQMGNFFCKTLLLVAVVGVLLVRKNEDVDKLKKLVEETTFYDKQWQATWQDGTPDDSKDS